MIKALNKRAKSQTKATVHFNIEALKAARTRAGWTQEQLTLFTGWSNITIQRAEAGVPVRVRAAMAICDALNTKLQVKVTLEDLRQKDDGSSLIYRTPAGDRFEKTGNVWIEYKNGKESAAFDEFDRDDAFIYMACRKRRGPGDRKMYVRIPIRGGDVQWTYENPLEWEAFVRVKPAE